MSEVSITIICSTALITAAVVSCWIITGTVLALRRDRDDAILRLVDVLLDLNRDDVASEGEADQGSDIGSVGRSGP